jgi:hypothetical protein
VNPVPFWAAFLRVRVGESVERAEPLVEQENLRLHRERAGRRRHAACYD